MGGEGRAHLELTFCNQVTLVTLLTVAAFFSRGMHIWCV